MSRPIAYNASGPLSGSIRGGNVNYTVDSGNRDYTTFASKKWVPSADGAAPIVFVTDTYTQGFEGNPSLAVPLFYSCNGTGSAAIIYTANRVPGSPGNYSDANVALNDLITARGYFILQSNDPYQGDDADSLAFDVDASKMSSYPQTGTNWRDLSGNGNTGVLTNGPTWDSKGWFDFDGTDDKVMIPYSPSLQPTTALTMEAWVYLDVVPSPWYSVFQSPEQNGAHVPDYFDWAIYINADLGLHTRINGIPAPSGTSTTTKMQVQRWTQTAISWEAGIVYFYLNGQLIQTQGGMPTSITYTNNTDKIIGSNAGGFEYVNGQISNVKLYSKRLLDSEVKQNYFGAPIVTDGLVFAVDANNIVSYPKSGTAWYNLTGSVASASLVNSPTFDQANGGAIRFDGTDEYAAVQYNSSLDITTAITVEAWVKYASQGEIGGVGRPYSVISYKGYPWTWLLEDQNGQFNFRISTTNVSDSDIPSNYYHGLNNWDHVVCTYNGSTQAIYVNGVLRNSKSLTGTINTSATTIELGTYSSGDYSFNGWLANHRVYNRALSAAEVQQNYQAEQYRFAGPQGIPTNGLVYYLDAANLESYPGSGTTAYSLVGSNNGTLNNGIVWNNAINGGAFIFDGTDDYIELATPANLPVGTSDRTIITFVKTPSTFSESLLHAFHYGTPSQDQAFGLAILRDSATVGYLATHPWVGTPTAPSPTLAPSTTYCLAVGYQHSNTTHYFWINGTPAAGTANVRSINTGTTTARVGSRISTPIEDWGPNGEIYVTLVYNRLLTDAEITQVYNSQKAKYGL
jgi:hypothetical protein